MFGGIKIIGTGSFMPEFKVTNDDFSKLIETSDDWIKERTGISERRFNFGGKNIDMAVSAAKNAVNDAGVSPESIDYVIASSSSPDYFYPSLSCQTAALLGITDAACVDVSAACTGFITALDIARSHLLAGTYKRILVIASENLSSQTDFSDRATCVLFGDGAGAVIVEKSGELYTSYIRSVPESVNKMSLYCKVRYNVNQKFADSNYTSDDKEHYIQMDGKAVYKFAVEAMKEAVLKASEKSAVNLPDIDIFIPHQANIRIINSAVKGLGIPHDKVHTNIDKHANTSSACIPTCLDELKKSGKLTPGKIVCMVGFGAGLTYGSIIFKA